MPTHPSPPIAHTGDRPILVAVLDDEALVRDALAVLLLKSEGFAVGALAGRPDDLLRQLEPATGVVLVGLHIDLPEDGWPDGGAAFLAAVRQRSPDARLLVLSNPIELSDVEASRRGGAAGHLSKGAPSMELLAAVRAVARGEEVFPPGAAWSAGAELAALTPREREVLGHLAQGSDNLKIAALLGITENTVKAHVAALYRKLEVENRVELMLLGRRAR